MENLQKLAVVIGNTGGIGQALVEKLRQDDQYDQIVGLARTSTPPLDLLDEQSIEAAAACVSDLGELRLVIDATGFLHDETIMPEKALKQITANAMLKNFQINAMGPALLMKHFLPLLPRDGRSVFASLSAKVGSISDNQIGGWHSYRAAKAAQHQFIKGASIEVSRTKPQAICVALHPGTVATELSAPFAKAGLHVHTPVEAASNLLKVVTGLSATDNGCFLNWDGRKLDW